MTDQPNGPVEPDEDDLHGDQEYADPDTFPTGDQADVPHPAGVPDPDGEW
jgi:hypothetical protein